MIGCRVFSKIPLHLHTYIPKKALSSVLLALSILVTVESDWLVCEIKVSLPYKSFKLYAFGFKHIHKKEVD